MLFYIDESIVEQAENKIQPVLEMLQDLLHAWKKGRCLVDASRHSFERLAAIQDLNEYKIVLKFKQGVCGIYQIIDFYVVLIYGMQNQSNTAPLCIEQAYANVVDYQEVKDERFFSSNNLLCENIEDSKIYKWGTEILIGINRNLTINVSTQMGGGNPIRNVAREYHNTHRMALCIIDSDKHHPSDNLGQTAREFICEYNSLQSPFLWYYITESREIENLLPFDLVDVVNLLPKNIKAFINSTDLSDEVLKAVFQYSDMKQGIKPSDIRMVHNDYPAKFILIRKILNSLGLEDKKIDKILRGHFSANQNSSVISFYGSSVLSKSSNYLEQINQSLHLFKLNPHQINDWENIKRKILSIGCAHNPKYC